MSADRTARIAADISGHPRRNLRSSASRYGQSMIETAVLLMVVVGALVVFFTFIRASVASRVKVGADTFGHGLLHNGN